MEIINQFNKSKEELIENIYIVVAHKVEKKVYEIYYKELSENLEEMKKDGIEFEKNDKEKNNELNIELNVQIRENKEEKKIEENKVDTEKSNLKEMIKEMPKQEKEKDLKMSENESKKLKHVIAKAVSESRISICNIERLYYLYQENQKTINNLNKSQQAYSICIKTLISLILSGFILGLEFYWIYNSPKKSKYRLGINLNNTEESLSNENETLRYLKEYLTIDNNNIFRYLDDLNDENNSDENLNDLNETLNDTLNNTLNETDTSDEQVDTNYLLTSFVIAGLYLYFTFYGIIARNFIYEGTLIGIKNTDSISLINFATKTNDYSLYLYLHLIQILSIVIGHEENISILENEFLMAEFYYNNGEVEELYTHDKYLPYYFLCCVLVHIFAYWIEDTITKCIRCFGCCCCKNALENINDIHLGINDYSKYLKYTPICCCIHIPRNIKQIKEDS